MLLDDRLALRIERACRLVEHQHRRIVNEGAGDREPLPLAARQIGGTFLQHRRIAVRQALDEFVGAGELRRPHHLFKRCRRLCHRDVFAHGAAEHEIFLQHDANLGP